MVGSSSILHFDPRRHPFKCFFFKLGLFFSILVVLDLIVGLTLRHFYFTQTTGVLHKTTYVFEKSAEKLLILGSSRASRSYVTDVFEKNLQMSAYNAGLYSQGILYYLAVWRVIHKRYLPKVIVLDISFGTFSAKNHPLDQLAALLPYYKYHPEIRDIVESRGPFEKIKLLSQSYPFNSLCLGILMGNLEFMNLLTKDIKGYEPAFKGKVDLPLQVQVLGYSEPDKSKVAAFRELLSDATAAGVKVVIGISPYYIKGTGKSSELELIIQEASKYNVPVIDYSQNEFFLKRPDLFMNTSHLNDDGANIYSLMLVHKVRAIVSMMAKGVHFEDYWNEAMDVPM